MPETIRKHWTPKVKAFFSEYIELERACKGDADPLWEELEPMSYAWAGNVLRWYGEEKADWNEAIQWTTNVIKGTVPIPA